MKKDRINVLVLAVCLIGLISVTGCATKKFVQGEMVTLDQKVVGVEGGVEANQKRLKEHDEQLETIGSLISRHDSQFKSVDEKIEEVRRSARGSLLFKETLRNDEARFKFDSYELGPEAAAALDRFVEKLISENKGVYIEIQGHTDATGSDAWNQILGKKRADAVLEHLYKKHHIPLHRMAAISYGSSAPVGDNATREGRAQNRRVEILVYE